MHPPTAEQREPFDQARSLFKLAKVWEQRGRHERAIAHYNEALIVDPAYGDAYLHLGSLLHASNRIVEATEVFRRGVEARPDESALHKRLIDCLTWQDGLDSAYALYGLEHVGAQPVRIAPQDVLCCVVVRNEAVRLPYFVDYHRRLGVARFLVVDNDSSDGTQAWLARQSDVYLWKSSLSFRKANFGSTWFELLLRRFGVGHWCLIVDADELLIYPDCERRSLPSLCSSLEKRGKRAFNAVLVDMYSDKPIRDTLYRAGQNFLDVCPYFDGNFFHRRVEGAGPYRNQTVYLGGARQRAFGWKEFYLSKVPLQKYGHDVILAGGQHWTNLPPSQVAAETGCVLHFKYFSTFLEYATQEAQRKEHSQEGREYTVYSDVLDDNPSLNLYSETDSVRFTDSAQVVRLGVMSGDTDPMLPSSPSTRTPPTAILPVGGSLARPLLSVAITCYKRLAYVERAIRSVLTQVTANPDVTWELEVVQDGTDPVVGSGLRRLLEGTGDPRVRLFAEAVQVGHPEIFNRALNRSRGHWVHILHDDDWVLPGFYEAVLEAAAAAPRVGAVFCHHVEVDVDGNERWVPPLERESPGEVENWVARIGVACRPACAGMVVRREVYERLGGFSSEVGSAWDWEMWKRVAIHYPVWYTPRSLARVLSHHDRETAQLWNSGSQVADALRCIGLSHEDFPHAYTDEITRKAKDHLAAYAINFLARMQIQAGNYAAAFLNLRQALRCSQSSLIKAHVIRLLSNPELG
jgi:glycosyltransferase involved in cell wall biosynthesis